MEKIRQETTCLQVAKAICDLSDEDKTALQIQKIMYFSHMLYMGENYQRLVKEPFLAWRFGPVVKKLHNYLESVGVAHVGKHNFPDILPIMNEKGSPVEGYEKQVQTIKDGFDRFKQCSQESLVRISRWPYGAWKLTCNNGKKIISDDLILQEYRARYKNGNE